MSSVINTHDKWGLSVECGSILIGWLQRY